MLPVFGFQLASLLDQPFLLYSVVTLSGVQIMSSPSPYSLSVSFLMFSEFVLDVALILEPKTNQQFKLIRTVF